MTFGYWRLFLNHCVIFDRPRTVCFPDHFESLQDHLAHIQEARQAVDALREDHERQKQARALEEQRLKQIQMQQKVDLMRQKKHVSFYPFFTKSVYILRLLVRLLIVLSQ